MRLRLLVHHESKTEYTYDEYHCHLRRGESSMSRWFCRPFPSMTRTAEYIVDKGTIIRNYIKNNSMNILSNTWLAIGLIGLPPAVARTQTVPGIPEPGLIVYGSILNAKNKEPLASGAISMRATGGNDIVTLNATFLSVNGESFYLVRVPFETRSIAGVAFTKTANTLALTNGMNYMRSVTVNGNPATVVSSTRNTLNTFTFNSTDRGLVERLNLEVSIDVPSPDVDSDGDGVPDGAEVIAGTDPHDPKSVFKLLTDIRPSFQGSLTITWSSVPGKSYVVSRSTDLGQGFPSSSAPIPSGGATTSFTDPSASGNGPFFYRIQVLP